MPKATVFNFSPLSARASDWSSSARRVEEERHLHRVEACGGNGTGFLLQLGGRSALKHHTEAKVVSRGFGAQELRRAEAGDRGSDGAQKMPA